MTLKKKIEALIQKIIDKASGSGVMQEENGANGEKFIFPNMPEKCLQSAEEGTVLLKNKNAVLPIKDEKISVFGRCQINYFYVGYGSGGDVNQPYEVSLIDGLKNNGVRLNEELLAIYKKWCADNPINHGFWGHWPMNYPEMELSADVVKKAGENSDKAIVVIGRAAGEDRENKLEKGSYYLTDTEINMLNLVTANFDKVIVIMNCGNIVDMSWVKEYGDKISGIIYAWQCGMESGNAIANILTGKANPSGRLADTIAVKYEDYPSAKDFGNLEFNNYTEDIFVGYRYFETFAPEKALYPFGFGLGYTTFDIEPVSFEYNENVKISVKVTNTGAVAGKEVVQIYVSAPSVKLHKAKKSLVAFKKTSELAPNESETLEFTVKPYDFASFDEDIYSYILEEGEYVFLTGNSVKTENVAGKVTIGYTVLEELSQICPVKNPFKLITGEMTKMGDLDLKKRILDNLPKEIGFKGDKGYKLEDVKAGKISLNEFISQLDNKELEALTRGQGKMDSHYGVVGNAGAFGGIIPSLQEKGIPPIITTDGPAGIRIRKYTSLIPCGTALACTWNTPLIEELTSVMGAELSHHKSDVLLAPGMNIHRNVLCGRNFEYFSEDPLLSGKMAGAYTRGIQSGGGSACPKHFACNNQEVKRTTNDSRLTQRALREIYLKGFEICVKEASPLNIMTSYNKINGVWSHYNYDLVTTVLRGEWGYEGNVMTDWWMQKSPSPEFPSIKDNAYRVRSQVDVLMPGGVHHVEKKYKSDGTLLKGIDTPSGITRAELERTAKNVLNLALKIKF